MQSGRFDTAEAHAHTWSMQSTYYQIPDIIYNMEWGYELFIHPPFHIFTYQGKIRHCCSSAGIIHHLRPNGDESERFSSLLELNAAYSVWGVKYISFIIAHLYRCYGCCFTAKISNNHHPLWSKEIKVFRWPLAHIFNFISAKNITTILFFLELTKQTCVVRFLIGIH